MKKQPVYNLHAFKTRGEENEFYANGLSRHVAEHTFTGLPHKHDFYLVVLVTQGGGYHEIDFVSYPVKRGSLFLMQPGQMHFWKLPPGIQGFVFFHSRSFYERSYAANHLSDFAFYGSFQSTPYLYLKAGSLEATETLMRQLVNEYMGDRAYRIEKLHALINLVYIEVARNYKSGEQGRSNVYLSKLGEFSALIEKHFRERLSPSAYAQMLHITEKHLNRIVRSSLNKTSTQVIADRVVLEAKRLLLNSQLSMTQIADELGFDDNSYFVRFFKKNAGVTPLVFLKSYNARQPSLL